MLTVVLIERWTDQAMISLSHDRDLAEEWIADRRTRGADHHDEVWDGMYVIPPLADDEHQFIARQNRPRIEVTKIDDGQRWMIQGPSTFWCGSKSNPGRCLAPLPRLSVNLSL